MTDMDIGKVSCAEGAGLFLACAVCSGSVPPISTMAMSAARNGAYPNTNWTKHWQGIVKRITS